MEARQERRRGVFTNCTLDRCAGPYGALGDIAVVGDWTGTGLMKTTKIGVFRPSNGRWYLDSDNDGVLELCGTVGIICLGPFGTATDKPIVGDWTGDGRAKIGLVRPNTTLNTLQWFLDRRASDVWQGCSVDLCRGPFGAATSIPVAGAW